MNKNQLEKKLKEISDIIESNYSFEKDIGVLAGISGASLFQFYYSKYTNNDKYGTLGMEIITEAVSRINNGYNLPTYCSGIAGLGWLVDHIEHEGLLDFNSDDLLVVLDDYLYSSMINYMQKGNYDFLHGGIGVVYYFLNRYKNTKSSKLRKKYTSILLEFIKLLKELSEENGSSTLKWKSKIYPKNNNPIEVYNLSLSHGISSIIAILTKLNNYNDFKKDTDLILIKAINYLLKHETKENTLSLFPNYIIKSKKTEYNSRIAWCYGDLGIGLRIWFAGKTLNDIHLKNKAISIVEHAAKRTSNEQSMVIDASICHGSHGNAQIFYRMYKETNHINFKKAFEFWLYDGVKKASFNDGFSGYKQWHGATKKWSNEISLLEGISGIGLTIIDYLANFDTKWDECLMIS